MSEEEKINQPTYDNPSIEENKTLAEALTDNNQPTTNMEVHKHPHHVTHKKKWGEYLLEFLMLFFAVFTGFKKQISHLIFLVLFALSIPQIFYGQESSKMNDLKIHSRENKLAGTWRIVEYSDLDTVTGKWTHRYGEQPRGYFTYTKSGIVSINISTNNPMKVSEDSAKKMSVNYFQMYRYNSFSYFGSYTIDWEKSIVTHHLKGGSILWYINTDQPRPFVLMGDTLIIGDNKTTKRVLVRAD